MNRPTLSLIAAVARNGAIGKDNTLLWHQPEDQQHFKRTTLGCPVIMGRKTWDSLPPRFRPLPGRRNIVITRNAAWRAEGAETVTSFEQARAQVADAPRAFVIGGAQVYQLALPWADELVLTEVDQDFDGDVWFPDWERERFQPVSREVHTTAQGLGYAFVTYRRLP